jgi:hypothetical protein
LETSAGSVGALRPLGVGEILDRAVTLCVKHFLLLALIWLLFAVPLALFQYFGTEDQTKVFGALADVLQKSSSGGKSSDPDALLKALQGKPIFNAWTVLTFVWIFLVAPLPRAALMTATSALYLGRPIDVAAAYRTALLRWPRLIGLAILWFLCGGILAGILFFGLGMMIFVLALVTAALHTIGVVIDIVFGVLTAIAFIAIFLVAIVAYEMGAFACVVENLGFVAAFASGLQRVFSQAGFRRSLLFGLAYIAISIGIFIVALIGQSVLLGLVRSQVLGMAFTVIVGIVTAGFVTGFFAIFYYDLRVRKEGLDLQLAVAATASAAPSTA